MIISTFNRPNCKHCNRLIDGTIVMVDEGVFCYACMIAGNIKIYKEEKTRFPEGAES